MIVALNRDREKRRELHRPAGKKWKIAHLYRFVWPLYKAKSIEIDVLSDASLEL